RMLVCRRRPIASASIGVRCATGGYNRLRRRVPRGLRFGARAWLGDPGGGAFRVGRGGNQSHAPRRPERRADASGGWGFFARAIICIGYRVAKKVLSVCGGASLGGPPPGGGKGRERPGGPRKAGHPASGRRLGERRPEGSR